MNPSPPPSPPPEGDPEDISASESSKLSSDNLFRFLVRTGSGLALGGMLASLAAIELGEAGKLEFRWHWAILPLTAVGLALGHWFWGVLWRAEATDTPTNRIKLRNASILLGLVALSSFWYPLRFVQEERRNEVLSGLGLAALVLSAFGWLIWKAIQFVTENEPLDGEVDPPSEKDRDKK